MRKLLLIMFCVLTYVTTCAQNIVTIAGGLGDSISAINTPLYNPSGTAIDALGNIYIADANNNVIRKLTVSTGIISTVAGCGIAGDWGDGGAAKLANLKSPSGVAVDSSGNIYIADQLNFRIRKVTASTGIISTVAGDGTAGYGGDGSSATTAKLSAPTGVAVDGLGNIYIADPYNYRIRKVNATNGIITTVVGNSIQGFGGDGGQATSANLAYPCGIAIDGSGNIYIADAGNSRIRKVTVSTGIIITVAGNGTQGYGGDGSAATSANLYNPNGVSVDGSGNIYIADAGNNRIRKVNALSGIITRVAGNGTGAYGGDGSAAISANLNSPKGIALDVLGNIYIADASNNRVRKVTASNGIISTVAGNGTIAYGGDGSIASSANLNYPSGLAVDGSGNIYIADEDNNRIRKVTASTGIISTVAGNGTQGYGGDGSAATSANLYNPSGVAVDGSGNIYIADKGNNRIRKISALTGIISTVAGDGTKAYGGDGNSATLANLNGPSGLTIDGSGNIYIADQFNHRIRKINFTTGIITTVAGDGTAGSLGDGSAATSASLKAPATIAVDGLGNIYIADQNNHRIRKVTASTGIISTVAGNGTATYGGDGSAATSASLNTPTGIAIDGEGNIYIADQNNHRIRKVTVSTGIISTVAGYGIPNYGGDGSTATSAYLNRPSGVALYGLGNIYITDEWNNRIRKVIPPPFNNIIYGIQTICAGAGPRLLSGTTPTDAPNSYSYLWLSSTTNATTGFTAIPSSNSTNYITGDLTQNTWFRRYAVAGAFFADTSAAIAITVHQAITNNTITGTAQTICATSKPATIEATKATGGNGTDYNYKWYKSTTSATTGFDFYAGGNDYSQNFTPNALTQNTWFKRQVISGACSDITTSLMIKVTPAITFNTMRGLDQSICSGSIPTQITATSATGGNGTTYTYKWLKSITNATNGFTNAGGNDSMENFISNPLTQNTWFRRQVTSGACTDTTNSALMVSVNPKPAINNATSASICSGKSTNITLAASIPSTFAWTLGNNIGAITGASASNGSTINQILTNPSNTNTGSLVYNVTPTSTIGLCVGNAAPITVTINPMPGTSGITGLANVAKLDTASYSVTGISGSAFNWLVSGATVQSGADSNQIQVKWSTIGTQQIKVTETSNKGCVGIQKSLSVTVSPASGINEIFSSKNINIYPNPTMGVVNISSNQAIDNIEVFDVTGKMVLNHRNDTHQKQIELDLSAFSNGIYFIQTHNQNAEKTLNKVVISK